jgi:predicted dehydrogenase
MERQENDGNPEKITVGTGWCFARQATGFIDALSDEAPPLTSGREGLADMEVSEAIWRIFSGCA